MDKVWDVYLRGKIQTKTPKAKESIWRRRGEKRAEGKKKPQVTPWYLYMREGNKNSAFNSRNNCTRELESHLLLPGHLGEHHHLVVFAHGHCNSHVLLSHRHCSGVTGSGRTWLRLQGTQELVAREFLTFQDSHTRPPRIHPSPQ